MSQTMTHAPIALEPASQEFVEATRPRRGSTSIAASSRVAGGDRAAEQREDAP